MKVSQFILILGFGLLSLNAQGQDTEKQEITIPVQEMPTQAAPPTQNKRAPNPPLAERLQLNAEQKVTFDAIIANYKVQMQEARESTVGDRAALQPLIKSLRENRKQEILTILTPEQAATYEEFINSPKPPRPAQKPAGNRQINKG